MDSLAARLLKEVLSRPHLVTAFRLLLAVTCGALIGIEREQQEKRAGLRTHILLCLGACLFALIGLRMHKEYPGGDALRLLHGLITGVGFLAAGVIFTQGASVRGLTTAVGLWSLTGIGLAVGLGYYGLAVFATLLIFIVIAWLKRVEPTLHPHAQPAAQVPPEARQAAQPPSPAPPPSDSTSRTSSDVIP
jgi:uncharacterized membrane protein YhiD involved in acid resistance